MKLPRVVEELDGQGCPFYDGQGCPFYDCQGCPYYDGQPHVMPMIDDTLNGTRINMVLMFDCTFLGGKLESSDDTSTP
jgi:hypothetical protein|eukprot:scaffold232_cov203-Alexandrium_tamarense.AAC.19